jgi:DNA polymerase-3 subunit delta
MPAATPPFIFVCGADDYLVNRLGKSRYDELTADVTDEFAREILSGFANNVGEVETAINRFRESVQTVSMFGGKRVIWFKDVNFLADTVTGRAESTLKLVEDLKEILAKIDPEQVAVVLTAAPVDRRRAFPKWCEKTGDFTLVGGEGEGGADALAGVILAEARLLGVSFGEGAAQLLLAKVGTNTRLLIEETRKLATYAQSDAATASGKQVVIEEIHVADLTANTAEGDFFEAAEAFFAGNLPWTMTALHHHFFTGGDARPIISALQNRNRILIQVRALVDAGEVRVGPRGLDGLPKAIPTYGRHFVGAPEKSSFNLFSQNAWYVGKLAGSAKLPSLRRLIDNQQEFIRAFEEIVQRPNEQNEVLREMAVRCLSAA